MLRRALRPEAERFLRRLVDDTSLIFALLSELQLQLARAAGLDSDLVPIYLDLSEPPLQLNQLVFHTRFRAGVIVSQALLEGFSTHLYGNCSRAVLVGTRGGELICCGFD